MVSTLRFHSLKEINIKERRPFWLLVTIVIALAVVVMNPQVALFLISILYVGVAVVENIWLYMRTGKVGGP
jgi:CDP-diacylglycerol--serine O-phosphatidyltransferase